MNEVKNYTIHLKSLRKELSSTTAGNQKRKGRKKLYLPYIKAKEITTRLDIFNLSEF